MAVKIVYYVHGTTTDNASGICSGWKNASLSDLGEEQAINLGKNTPYRFDVLFTSDLGRAISTAKLAFPEFEGISDKRLRECNYGDLDGKSKKLVNYSEHIKEAFPNGESLEDVVERVRDFLEHLEKNYPNKTVGIIAHRAPQLAMEVLTRGKTLEQAVNEDWRKTGDWRPGWEYLYNGNMIFQYYNPVEEKGGCILRTMSKLFDKDYEVVKNELINLSKELGYDDYHETEVFEKYLDNNNYKKQELEIPVSELNINGKYAVLCHKDDNYHMFSVIDGVVYDKSLKYLDMDIVSIYKCCK